MAAPKYVYLLSDLHAGNPTTPSANITAFCNLLHLLSTSADLATTKVVLVGDIVDQWVFGLNLSSIGYATARAEWKVIVDPVVKAIVDCSKAGAEVVYLKGNHDEHIGEDYPELEPFMQPSPYTKLPDISIEHGHRFDALNSLAMVPSSSSASSSSSSSSPTTSTSTSFASARYPFGYFIARSAVQTHNTDADKGNILMKLLYRMGDVTGLASSAVAENIGHPLMLAFLLGMALEGNIIGACGFAHLLLRSSTEKELSQVLLGKNAKAVMKAVNMTKWTGDEEVIIDYDHPEVKAKFKDIVHEYRMTLVKSKEVLNQATYYKIIESLCGNMEHWVRKSFSTRVVIMGHTHTIQASEYKLGNEEKRFYYNLGSWTGKNLTCARVQVGSDNLPILVKYSPEDNMIKPFLGESHLDPRTKQWSHFFNLLWRFQIRACLEKIPIVGGIVGDMAGKDQCVLPYEMMCPKCGGIHRLLARVSTKVKHLVFSKYVGKIKCDGHACHYTYSRTREKDSKQKAVDSALRAFSRRISTPYNKQKESHKIEEKHYLSLIDSMQSSPSIFIIPDNM